MDNTKFVIAQNITQLRQNRKMTQNELAEKLNYSDKAVSKWERGESLPDVLVLKSIADLFGVSLDYLLEEEHTEPTKTVNVPNRFRMRTIVTLLSILIGWFVATVLFVTMDIIWPQLPSKWLPFAYAVPVSMIVWLVFNSIWFNRRRNYLIISLLMWSLLLAVMLTFFVAGLRAWQILLLGVPGQVAIAMWSRFASN